MSYEPYIFISHRDLQAKQSFIDNEYLRLFDKKKRSENLEKRMLALAELVRAVKHDPILFKKEKFVMIHPDLTSHNKRVRAELDRYQIYYTTYC